MPPRFIERLAGDRPPEPSFETQELIDATYQQVLAEFTGRAEHTDQEFSELYDEMSMDDLSHDNVTVLVATYLAWEIRNTYINRPRDDRRAGLAYMEKSDALADVMEYGRKMDKWHKSHGGAVQSGGPYSIALVASATYQGVSEMLEIKSNKDWKRFIGLFTVAPYNRKSIANLQ